MNTVIVYDKSWNEIGLKYLSKDNEYALILTDDETISEPRYIVWTIDSDENIRHLGKFWNIEDAEMFGQAKLNNIK